MSKVSPDQRAAELRALLQQASYDYYVLDRPALSDAEYDRLFRELQAIEREHPELRTADSPTMRVGAEPASALAKHTHLVPMISLGNAFTETRSSPSGRSASRGSSATTRGAPATWPSSRSTARR